MKNGDIVVFVDGSYALEITGDGLKETFPNSDPHRKKRWKVIDTELELPADNQYSNGDEINDTIVRSMENPSRYIFTQEMFLRHICCPTCNKYY